MPKLTKEIRVRVSCLLVPLFLKIRLMTEFRPLEVAVRVKLVNADKIIILGVSKTMG